MQSTEREKYGGGTRHFLAGHESDSARHIMFAHPFYAPCPREALDMEKQALGRINRTGQLASFLILWRIVTEGTLEQELHEQHAGEAPLKRHRHE